MKLIILSGYRTIIISLLLAWYFGTRVEHIYEGAFIKAMIGPFDTEIECKFHRSAVIDAFDELSLKYVITKCEQPKET